MRWISSPFPEIIVLREKFTLGPNASQYIYLGNFEVANLGNIAQGETTSRKINLVGVYFLQGNAELAISVTQDGGESYTPIFQTWRNKTVHGMCLPSPKIPLKYASGYSFYKISFKNSNPLIMQYDVLLLIEVLEEEAEEYQGNNHDKKNTLG